MKRKWSPTEPCVKAAVKYATQVAEGKIDVCVYVRQACERFLKDTQRQKARGFPYYLDETEARRRCAFQEKLPHTKGKWAARRERVKLSPWQVFCHVNIFGWKHKTTHLRRFREVYIEVPRKNGKSLWVAGMGLSILCLDEDAGSEVYCGASTEKQAWEVFKPAKMIVDRVADLQSHFGLDPLAKSIVRHRDGAKFEPIIGNPGDGASPSCAIADEFHEHTDSDQVDTMMTGMGAREQPLMFYITTSGSDTGGPCFAKRDDVVKILAGTVKDETVFGIIYTLDDDDEWDTIAAQKKANPNYGVSVSKEFLEGQLNQAKRSAAKQNAYKTKHLDLWVGARAAWMNLLAFQRCRKQDLALESFRGERCYLGVDLASRVDVASLAMVFPPSETHSTWAAFFRRWVPEERVLEEEGNRYQGWHAGGWLEATPGNVIDFDYIEDEIEEISKQYEIQEVAYDPFQATQFSVHMLERGFPMVEFGATVKNFSEPMKELEALILKQQILFQKDPMALWMMGNVTAKLDRKDNIFPSKEREPNKIDDIIALIMATARASAHVDEGLSLPSDYSVTVA